MATPLQEAKDYLLKRLDAERKMSRYLDEALISAARRIVNISLKYNIKPSDFRFSNNPQLKKEVEEVLALLREMLYEKEKEHLTFKTEEDKKFIPAILTDKDHDKTLKERIAIYTNRYGYEVEAIVAAALLSGEHSAKKIIQSIQESLHSPWSNPYFQSEKGKGEAVRLKEGGVSYGVGKTTSSANGLAVVLGYVLARGWMENWRRMGTEAGARGFYTFRNSSFPCQLCDEEAMRFHTMDEPMPPFHPHCVCGVEFVY